MVKRFRNSYAEVDLGALTHNFLALKALLHSNSKVCPMVKADAYGHGDLEVSKRLEELGSDYLGVALVEEGVKLRSFGVKLPILVFGDMDSVAFEACIKYSLTPVVSQTRHLEVLKNLLHEGAQFPVHIKFNTGMQRIGFEPEEATTVAKVINKQTKIKLEGVCTHFASAEDFSQSPSSTQEQIRTFTQIAEEIKGVIKEPLLWHYLNSVGILNDVKPQLDMARPGISLYGCYPKMTKKLPEELLRPVLTVKTHIAFLHKVKKGRKVSYGGTWQASKDSLIAVLPLGYADGLPRSLSNKGQVIIRDTLCPISGIVCMDYVMIDVSSLSEKNLGPELGDEVVVIGKQTKSQIRAEEIAEKIGTISYEILTGIQSRVPRIYI